MLRLNSCLLLVGEPITSSRIRKRFTTSTLCIDMQLLASYFQLTHKTSLYQRTRDFHGVQSLTSLSAGLVTAVNRNFSVVDATATVTALHQTGVDGNNAGHRQQKGDDTYVNHRLAGRFDYSNGITTCANLMTRWRKYRVVLVKQPDVYRKRCIRTKNMYNINKGKRIASKNVFSSKYSRYLRKMSDLKGLTTISSRGVSVTSHTTRVILPTPMRADVIYR